MYFPSQNSLIRVKIVFVTLAAVLPSPNMREKKKTVKRQESSTKANKE
jgi:hypothetical protein